MTSIHFMQNRVFFLVNRFFLEFRKCYSITLMFTFNIPQIVCPGTKTDSRICVEVENIHFCHFKICRTVKHNVFITISVCKS